MSTIRMFEDVRDVVSKKKLVKAQRQQTRQVRPSNNNNKRVVVRKVKDIITDNPFTRATPRYARLLQPIFLLTSKNGKTRDLTKNSKKPELVWKNSQFSFP